MFRGVLLVGLPGLLPVFAIVGRRFESAALVLPVGALLAAVGTTGAVLTSTEITPWVVGVDVLANLGAGLVVARQVQRGRPWKRQHFASRPALILPCSAAVVGAASGLIELVAPKVDWDARSIWLLHARLLLAGGGAYRAAVHSPAYAFSHVDYPPLIPSAAAVAWTGAGVDYRVAQVLVALVGASLLACFACLITRVASPGRQSWVAAVVAFEVVVAGYGLAGRFATDGYADLTQAAAAAAAAVALLVLPVERATVVVGILCCWIAGATKQEGLVAALIVIALFAVRVATPETRNRVGIAAIAVAAPLGIWPLVVIGAGGTATSGLTRTAEGLSPAGEGFAERLKLATSTVAHDLRYGAAVVVVATLAVWWLGGARRRFGLAPNRFLWAFLGLDVAAILLTYATGGLEIRQWLDSSASRVTILPGLILLAELATWTLVASESVRTTRRARAARHDVLAPPHQPAPYSAH
jgi:hypothetical protein